MDEGREETAIRSLLTENKKLKQKVFELEEMLRKVQSGGDSQGGSSSVLKLIEHKDFQLEQLTARLEEKKQLLEEAERNALRYAEILDRDATALVGIDAQGCIAFYNRAALQRVGERLKASVGHKLDQSGLLALDPTFPGRIRQVSGSGKAEEAAASRVGTVEPLGAPADELGVLVRIRANPPR